MLLTDRGIFIIEFKDYSGAIYGNESNKNWKAYYKNGYNKSFRNPVKQNENHKKTLEHLLDENDHNFNIFNIVVFGDKSSLNKIHSSIPVIKKESIIEEINKYHKLVLEEKALSKLRNFLMLNNITNPIERKKHIKFVNSISSNKTNNNNEKTLKNFAILHIKQKMFIQILIK